MINSKIFILSSIIPFNDRRASFVRFVKANDIELTKERTKCGLAYIISKQDIQKAFNLFKKSPKKPNYFSEMSLLEKAFLDVEIFLKQGNLK